MIGIAWVLDRADNVPDLFVQVLEDEPEPAVGVGVMPEAVKA